MHVVVTVNNKHRLTFEANQKEDSSFDVHLVSRSLDLRAGDRFTHVFDPRNTLEINRSLLPLPEKTEEVFRALSFLESHSPIVTGLRSYHEQRLPYVLDRISGKIPSSSRAKDVPADQLQERLEQLRRSPEEASGILSRIVARIDKDLPQFFKTERELETHQWLRSGGISSLPFSLARERDNNAVSIPFGFANPKETHVPYRIDTQTAFFPEGTTLHPVEILSALGISGGCGESLRLLNRAAAMWHMTRELTSDIERARSTVQKLSSPLPPHQRSFIFYTALNALVGSIGVIGGGAGALRIAQSGVSFSDLGAFALGTAAILGAAISQKASHTIRAHYAKKNQKHLARAHLFLEKTDAEIQSVLAATLLRYIDDRGAGRAQTLLAPLPSSVWEREFEGMEFSDERVFCHRANSLLSNSSSQGTHQDFTKLGIENAANGERLSWEVQEEIKPLLDSELICLHHTEVADRHWHLMHAVDLCSSFAERMGILRATSLTLPLRELLRDAQRIRCNHDGVFTPIIRPFSDLRRSFRLDDDAWQFVARPLFAVHALETACESLRAKEITIEEIMR
jgi:hypothetical protein